MQIQANSISIGYDIDGPEDAPVVTLSHSLAANRHMWWPQIDVLKENYRVLRYDTRGHGTTDVTEGPYSIALLVDDVVALLAELNIAETHFIGLSMGGMIGQLFAANHSEKLLSLTLCATACQMASQLAPVWDERIEAAQKDGMASLAEVTVDRWFTSSYRTNSKREVERIIEMIQTTPAKGFAGCGQAIKTLNQLNALDRVTAPTLILVGSDDPSTPPSTSQIIHRHIKESEMIVIDNASHMLNVEQSKRFNEELTNFLQTQ